MPVLYKTIQSTMKTKDGDKLYHPRTVYVGSVNTEKIAQEIAEYSSLSKGDVKNSIDNLVAVMTRHLQSSEVVMLDGLGSFRLAMKSRGKEQRRSIRRAGLAAGTLQSGFYPQFGPYRGYPLIGDRCEVCTLQTRNNKFR